MASPVHAYLFVGPPGSTKEEAARAFAAAVLGGGEPAARDVRLARAGEHPDIREVVRTGPFITAEQAREIARLATLAPIESDRKVMILHELHLLRPEGAALLLKTIEEPPASTVFVALAEFVPPELVTVASRCVRIDFRSIPVDVLSARLEAESTERDSAVSAAESAGGDLARARILAHDPGVGGPPHCLRHDPPTPGRHRGGRHAAGRRDCSTSSNTRRLRWSSATAQRSPSSTPGLSGSGSGAAGASCSRSAIAASCAAIGPTSCAAVSGSSRRPTAICSWPALSGHARRRPDAYAQAVTRIHEAVEALERNPNEQLLLQALLWSLPTVNARAR